MPKPVPSAPDHPHPPPHMQGTKSKCPGTSLVSLGPHMVPSGQKNHHRELCLPWHLADASSAHVDVTSMTQTHSSSMAGQGRTQPLPTCFTVALVSAGPLNPGAAQKSVQIHGQTLGSVCPLSRSSLGSGIFLGSGLLPSISPARCLSPNPTRVPLCTGSKVSQKEPEVSSMSSQDRLWSPGTWPGECIDQQLVYAPSAPLAVPLHFPVLVPSQSTWIPPSPPLWSFS